MFGGKILLAGYTTLLVLVLFSVNCYARKSDDHNCVPSSCGNNDNITNPFRLKGDPTDCGDNKYELECENNRTVLHLFSGKYYVEEIDYDNYRIRVVDEGIHKDDCSSLPLHSLTQHNFNKYHHYYDSPYHLIPYHLGYEYESSLVVFMNCENPVKHPPYIERNNRGSCTKGGGNSSGSVKGQHLYVVVGDLKVSDVADLCTVEMMVPMPLLMSGENRGNISISFLDVHNATAYGFELYFDSYYFYHYYGFVCPPNSSPFNCVMSRTYLYPILVLYLTVSTATTERSFSAMKIVKSRLRNKMEDEFLTDSLLVYIEKEIAENFTTESIIEDFRDMKERRVLL